jgi:hypothetical protein
MHKYVNNIKEGIGFGASFMVTLCHLKYCLDNNIKVYIQINNSGYAEDPSVNCWDRLFEQPFDITEEKARELEIINNFDIIGTNGYWKLNYGDDNRHNFRDIEFLNLYRDIINQHVVIKKEISSQVNNFLSKYNGKILGIHKRGRDHYHTGHGAGQAEKVNLNKMCSVINKYIDNYDYLYVTSDESYIYEDLIKIYGDKVIFFDNKEQFNKYSKMDLNQQTNPLNQNPLAQNERVALLNNLMVETLILSRCDQKILLNSNVSHMALLFSSNNNFIFYDEDVNYE